MNLKSYVEFTRLCVKYNPNKELDYLTAGFISELGEFLGVQAKYVREDYEYIEYKKRLKKELGDVCWMYFRLVDYSCKVLNMSLDDLLAYLEQSQEFLYNYLHPAKLEKTCIITLECFSKVLESLENNKPTNLKISLRAIYIRLNCLAYALEVPLESVINENVAKLTERLYSNTIKGDGEERQASI